MLSGANAFEISDIERMNIGAHQHGVEDVTMLFALWLPEMTIRQGQEPRRRQPRKQSDHCWRALQRTDTEPTARWSGIWIRLHKDRRSLSIYRHFLVALDHDVEIIVRPHRGKNAAAALHIS
jgi:hypothetical protein